MCGMNQKQNYSSLCGFYVHRALLSGVITLQRDPFSSSQASFSPWKANFGFYIL